MTENSAVITEKCLIALLVLFFINRFLYVISTFSSTNLFDKVLQIFHSLAFEKTDEVWKTLMKTAETVLANVNNIGYTSFYSYIEVSSVKRQ